MKKLLRISLVTLMLAGTFAAIAYPTASALVAPGEGSDPMPTCFPTDPGCKPPIPPPAG